MRQQVVGFCELYMLVMGSWSVMGGSTLDVPNSVYDLKQTLECEWCTVGWEFKSVHQKVTW